MDAHEKVIDEIRDKEDIIKNLQEQISYPANLRGNISEMEMINENRRINEENYELKSRLAFVESKIKKEAGELDLINKEYMEHDVKYLKETIDRQESQIIKLHEQYQQKMKDKDAKMEKLNAKLKEQDKQLKELTVMIDRFEDEKKSGETSLLEQINKSIANVYDNDKMRSKIRA